MSNIPRVDINGKWVAVESATGKYVRVSDLVAYLNRYKLTSPKYVNECFDQSWNMCVDSIIKEFTNEH